MTVYFHVPAAPHKPTREITREQYHALSNRKRCLIGYVMGKGVFFWQLSYSKRDHSNIWLTQAQLEGVVALMAKENEQK